MRTLGPSGNPRADNLFEIVSFLQSLEGIRFHFERSLPDDPSRSPIRRVDLRTREKHQNFLVTL